MNVQNDWQPIPRHIEQSVNKVIEMLQDKGIQYEENLIQCQRQGKTSYQFILPKSKYYSYYLSRLNEQVISQRERKKVNQEMELNKKQIIVEGNIQQVSVGAMCEFVKQLLQTQSKTPYEPFENESFYQEFSVDINSFSINAKVKTIIQKITSFSNQSINLNNSEQIFQNNAKTWKQSSKIDKFRKQLGTQNDGSLGSWGGKKYQGLGSRNEFTDFRRQKSQAYYQLSSKEGNQLR